MAYFRCGQGAGGNELKILITTTDTSLYGQTITISKGGSTVGTTTFDNTGNAEYTVDEAGLYTVSCGGASESVLVEDEYEVSLSAIPDGSTVTPVNDIQTWLNCAGIFNKTTYTTISDVLADTTTLLALINSNNAVDYMVRSHAWCDDVCADATAMTYIGANNYAADTLLADDGTGNWLESICNSTYFESVLNVKVPTMTSDTTPSGQCYSNPACSSSYPAYRVFDGNDSTEGSMGTAYKTAFGYYRFTAPVKVQKFDCSSVAETTTYTIKGSDDGTTWNDVAVYSVSNGNKRSFVINAPTSAYAYWGVERYSSTAKGSTFYTIQFYGRAAS